ncbi:hypothetical protein GGC47_000892 [Bosea sp. OAE752]|jgi:hypothetical protein|uniref:DUF4260 domain-containing protein n=1 Tax=Bosea spartocytisi TaxID=2773451 RepID=A0A927EDQ3_9HYPH|nr:DUF4260 domain-containing protein [Bosea spartocytisi]MBD3846814.1 DUF4260 domain-containing protein [Bosea spartocytisi]MCT4473550.1 DUF4260 domain-containing protein [Bosea spartocytisi]
MTAPFSVGQVQGAPRLLLRLEGLALGLLCIWLFHKSGASWWLFGSLILAPDLTMLGYLAGPRFGAVLYNAGHTLLWPVLLAVIGWGVQASLALALALIWAAHITLDRALGYGLKYSSAFNHTHLGTIGQPGKAQ